MSVVMTERGTLLACLAGATALAAAACSNNPPPAPGPTPGNRAPVFTSSSTASVAEETAGVAYAAAATDADGDAVTFSLAGGADQAQFSITQGGALSFNTPPDFENPRDADLNNTYIVVIRASDGTAGTTLTLTVTVTDGPESYGLRRVGTGFSSPMFLIGRPGEDDVFVAERAGRILLFDPETGIIDPTPFLDITADVGTAGEGGLLGLAPAPDYAVSGVIYVHITNTGGDTEIRRYVVRPAIPMSPTSLAAMSF